MSHTVGLRRLLSLVTSIGLASLSLTILSLSSLSGCMAFAPVVDEPLRFATVADLTPRELGLRPGESTFEEARAAMTKRGLTGIVESEFASDAPHLVSVLGADYQSRLLVFRDGRFRETVELPLHGLPPYGMSVRLGREGASELLLVLYRDPANRAELPPTLLAFRSDVVVPSDIALAEKPAASSSESRRTPFTLVADKPLGDLVAAHEGMTSPMLLGGDMAEGMFLVARDQDGVLWDTSYVVRVSDAGALHATPSKDPAHESARPRTSLSLEPRPMMDAIRCSCVRKYALGASNP